MKKVYYLDTNICIFHLRKSGGIVTQKIYALEPEIIKLPAIVKAELITGAFKSERTDENMKKVINFCAPFEIIPFDDSMTEIYGKIKSNLERTGKRIGFNDLIIAATVFTRGGVLVTNNINEFSRIDGLILEDWTQ